MNHIAIMKKEWNMVEKILSSEKTIESRWYMTKRPPYNKISKNDTVFFKEGDIKAKSEVKDVIQFSDLNPIKVKKILDQYGKEICIFDGFYNLVKNKKYCILIFLKNPEKAKIKIKNKGMNAWICVEDINSII